LNAPLQLLPVTIPKPWGREIWFTGIEARGVCSVSDRTTTIPLPALLELAPDLRPLVLVKILEPRADEFGDLYFELHETKAETYVITHVDRTAWPGGVGQIRLGMHQGLRVRVGNDARFRAAYLAATRAYERARNAATAARMNQFIAHRSVRVGDVVHVPPLTPHGLLRGVRVVEAQTPVFERLLMSFGQDTPTQRHWDTERAVAVMNIEPPTEIPTDFSVVVSAGRVVVTTPSCQVTVEIETGRAVLLATGIRARDTSGTPPSQIRPRRR